MPSNAQQILVNGVLIAVALAALIYPFIYPPVPLHKPKIDEDSYADIPDFRSIDNVIARKQAFFSYLIPEIDKQNAVVLEQRHWVLALQRKLQDPSYMLSNGERQKLGRLRQQYKVAEDATAAEAAATLTRRVDILPKELVLVQAANESAWGTSRFARLGYNFFGMWCFKPGCGFVPALRPEGAINEVAKFPDLAYAVRTYLTNLNRHPAYEELRGIRYNLRQNQQPVSAEALAQGLMRYSERGQDYIEELLDMIRVNKKYMQI